MRLPDPAFLSKLEALRLSVRSVHWGGRLGGRFPINRRGSSIEFADYAVYTPGDEIQSIDWNLYARLDRLFVRTYKEEVELTVEIMLDATASMAVPSRSKFERVCQLALCLAYVGLAGGHQVRMSVIKPGPLRLTPRMIRRPDLARFAEWIRPIAPEGHVELTPWMHLALSLMRTRGGQALILSDWMHRQADCFQALHTLLGRHVEVKLIQVLSPEELNPARLLKGGLVVDSETGMTHELAYSASELTRAMMDHNEHLARFCKRSGVLFAQHQLDESLETFVLNRLPARGFLE